MKAFDRDHKSKLAATWMALIGGSFGMHRFYLHGARDPWAWCSVPLTLLGVYGLQRARQFGLDDHVSWLLMPVLGLMLAAGMLAAIMVGLTPDERWDSRFNPTGATSSTGWLTILGVLLALALGATALMATIAFSAQRFFEYQAGASPKAGP